MVEITGTILQRANDKRISRVGVNHVNMRWEDTRGYMAVLELRDRGLRLSISLDILSPGTCHIRNPDDDENQAFDSVPCLFFYFFHRSE